MARFLLLPLAAVALLSHSALAQNVPAAPTITNVLVTLSVKEGITREQIMKVMQTEVRDTVKLYLDGKIQQWYSKGDGRGVVFLLNCKSVEEAKAVMEALPLSKEKLANFEYLTLGPLMPLRLLLGVPGQ